MYPHYQPHHPYPTILGSGFGVGAPSTVPTSLQGKPGLQPPSGGVPAGYEIAKPGDSWGPRGGAYLRAAGHPGLSQGMHAMAPGMPQGMSQGMSQGMPQGMAPPPLNLQMHLPASSLPDGRALLPMRDVGDLTVEYFKIGRFVGRGGQIRLYLLGRQIKHQFIPVPVDNTWPERKRELIESKRSCQGTLPIATHQGQTFCESSAILRYIAKKIGEYGQNHQIDYYSDMLVDKLAYWRDELMAAVQDWNQLDSAGIQRYKGLLRQTQYELFERILSEAPPRYNLRPSWAHFALFSVIWDDLRLLEGDGPSAPDFTDLLSSSPRLQALYEEIRQMPLVQQWIVDLEPQPETPSNAEENEVVREAPAAQMPTDFAGYYPAYSYVGPPPMYPSPYGMPQHMPMPAYPTAPYFAPHVPARPMAYPPGSVPLYQHPGAGFDYESHPNA